jgi:FixJ family two-component response regulator
MHLNNEGEKLTERELQIAILICKDKFSKQIAAELEIETQPWFVSTNHII